MSLLKGTLSSYTAIHLLEANSVATIKTRLTRSNPLNLQVSLGYKPGPEGDATLLEGVLTHPWDGEIHSSHLLNPQMLSGGVWSGEGKTMPLEKASVQSSVFKIVSRRVRFSLN